MHYYITLCITTLHVALLHYMLHYYITCCITALHAALLHYIMHYYITLFITTLHDTSLYTTYYVVSSPDIPFLSICIFNNIFDAMQ